MSESLRGFYGRIDDVAATGDRVAVATIARTRGSTPRETGAKMIIRSAGETLGTVGGGCGEAEVWRTALDVIADGKPRMVHVELTEEIAMASEGVCGGTLDVFVDAWGPDQRALLRGGALGPGAAADLALIPAIEAGEPVVLATVIERTRASAVPIGAKILVRSNGTFAGTFGLATLDAAVATDAVTALSADAPTTRAYPLGDRPSAGTVDVLLEPHIPPSEIVIFGAGHIAQPLARLASMCDFRVTVIDDRATFSNAERFPDADSIVVADVESAVRALRVTPRTYVVLVTRAHAHDVFALRHLIHKDSAYIGMIGAQRRVWAVFKLLNDEGVSADLLAKVHAPIGVDIGAETPAEIAISIMAEIVNTRRGGPAPVMSDRLRDRFQRRLRANESLDEPDLT
ncbi:MAG: XdhC/CoxI family protein [Chloroflexota bacterium]|nr:MAG: XdhC/CoxI family protein [Chloroflexota bacterium]